MQSLTGTQLTHLQRGGLIGYDIRVNTADAPTVTNLITNGDFATNTTGWSVGTIGTWVSGRVQILATSRWGNVSQSKTTPIGHIMYAAAELEGTTGAYLCLTGSPGNTLVYNPSGTGKNRVSLRVAASTASSYLQIGDSRSSAWTAFYADNVVLIDLTAAFGAGNEPTQATMDAWLLANDSTGWFDGATTYSKFITEDDILDGSFVLDRSNWSSGQSLEIGNADAAELSFTLENSDGRWGSVRLEGSTLTLTWDINGETLAGGIFIADSQSKGGEYINVSSLDYMSKFAVPYDGNLTYPATLLQIVQDACTDCGVTLHSTSFTNSDYSVTAAPTDPGITYQNLIAWAAQIAGCNAWIDEDGELRLTWYGDTNVADGNLVDASMECPSVQHGETDIQVTGIRYIREQTEYTVGSVGYEFRFSDNPLLQDNISTALLNIYNKVSLVRFLPFPVLPTVPLPHIWPGDVLLADAISLTGDDGAEITAAASTSDIAKVTNTAGISGADLSAKTYRKAAVLVGKHTISTQSSMVGVGETAKSFAYATGQTLSSAQMNAVKAVATTKIETLAIERSLTVGGKNVVVRIDDTNGISITTDGTKVFGVDSAGNVFAQSLSNLTDGSYYMTYGYNGSPGIECFMPTIGKWLGISPAVDGSIQFYDADARLRLDIAMDGGCLLYDDAGHLSIWIDKTQNFAQLHLPSATDNAIGVDATGAYKIVGGVKTYL